MFQLTTTEPRGGTRTETFATFAELREYATEIEGLPMTRFTARVAGRPHTSYAFQGWTWEWAEVAEPTDRVTVPALAELVVALSMGGQEIADELGVTIRTVEAWVYGVRQPSAANRTALLALIERVYDRVQRRASAARLQAFSNCRIALNLRTPAQREAWLARRAELRAQLAH